MWNLFLFCNIIASLTCNSRAGSNELLCWRSYIMCNAMIFFSTWNKMFHQKYILFSLVFLKFFSLFKEDFKSSKRPLLSVYSCTHVHICPVHMHIQVLYTKLEKVLNSSKVHKNGTLPHTLKQGYNQYHTQPRKRSFSWSLSLDCPFTITNWMSSFSRGPSYGYCRLSGKRKGRSPGGDKDKGGCGILCRSCTALSYIFHLSTGGLWTCDYLSTEYFGAAKEPLWPCPSWDYQQCCLWWFSST